MSITEFGRALRGLRLGRAMTMEQLAEASGVSVRGISDMELGNTRRPRQGTIAALAQALRLDDAERAELLAATTAELWFERAARLSTDNRVRAERLLTTGELAYELDRYREVQRCIGELITFPLEAQERLRLLWLQSAFDDGDPGEVDGIQHLVDAARRVHADGATDLAAMMIMSAARRSFFRPGSMDLALEVLSAAEGLGLDAMDPRLVNVQALTATFSLSPSLLQALRRWAKEEVGEPDLASLLAFSAFVLADFELAESFCAQAAVGHRQQGKRTVLAQVLNLRAWAALYQGRWDAADLAAAESYELAVDTQQPGWTRWVRLCQVILAALRGAVGRADQLLVEVEDAGMSSRNGSLRNGTLMARSLTELARGRADAAFDCFRRLMDDSPDGHGVQRCWQVDLFADVAVAAGRVEEARAVLAGLEATDGFFPSPGVDRSRAYARAVLAEDAAVEQAVFEARQYAGTSVWYSARLDLALGVWLRRRRRTPEADALLRDAAVRLRSLGAAPWAERATRELGDHW
ncbi:helix-turn-helix domain-containing protein [Streptomyces sp. NBC_01450]|uniref:helix-turn-helix transcriptional regulator n=1 Tax=Streptomyces sp. NBC_01450 TaxID=2903871 RepID=UPI002E35CBD1|nr:helix-turn-helix transcriptional regulator [Streptomyces sp. NBC_01450]